MRLILALVLGAMTFACSTSSRTAGAHSRAEVTVDAIAPAASAELTRAATLEATIAYRIEDFQPEPNRYYLTIQFEQPGGNSFNHYRSFSDEPMLTIPQGTVHVTYAMASVWDDRRLKKPIRVWFYVVERIGPHESMMIGKAGPIEYVGK